MKVLIVSYEWPPIGGGVGKALEGFVFGSKELRDEYDVDLSVLSPTIGSESAIMSLGHRAEQIALGIPKQSNAHWTPRELLTWFTKATWQRWIDHIKPDVTHFWGGFPCPLMPIRKRPYIVTVHGSDCPGRNPRFNWVYYLTGIPLRWSWQGAACRTAVTPRLAELAQMFSGRPVQCVPNGIERPGLVTRKQPHRPLRVLAVTRIAALKNIQLLVQLASLGGNEIQLRIAGDGRDFNAYTQSSSAIDNIEWVGWRTSLVPDYQWADVFVNVADVTGVNMAMLEAKSWHLPIVSTLFPGCDELSGLYPSGSEPYSLLRALRHVSHHYFDAIVAASNGTNGLFWPHRARPYYNLYKEAGERNLR